MPVYDDIFFPEDISWNSPGRPMFGNKIARLPSGFRVVDIKRATPLWEFDVGYGARKINRIYDLLELFLVVQGSAHVFLFKNWLDYTSLHGEQDPDLIAPTDQLLGVATAGQTQFQLVKNYQVASATLQRKIYKPKAGTVVIAVDAVPEVWTVNTTTGIVTRGSPLAGGEEVTAGYEYFLPVAFAEDTSFDAEMLAPGAGAAKCFVEEQRLEP